MRKHKKQSNKNFKTTKKPKWNVAETYIPWQHVMPFCTQIAMQNLMHTGKVLYFKCAPLYFKWYEWQYQAENQLCRPFVKTLRIWTNHKDWYEGRINCPNVQRMSVIANGLLTHPLLHENFSHLTHLILRLPLHISLFPIILPRSLLYLKVHPCEYVYAEAYFDWPPSLQTLKFPRLSSLFSSSLLPPTSLTNLKISDICELDLLPTSLKSLHFTRFQKRGKNLDLSIFPSSLTKLTISTNMDFENVYGDLPCLEYFALSSDLITGLYRIPNTVCTFKTSDIWYVETWEQLPTSLTHLEVRNFTSSIYSVYNNANFYTIRVKFPTTLQVLSLPVNQQPIEIPPNLQILHMKKYPERLLDQLILPLTLKELLIDTGIQNLKIVDGKMRVVF